MNNMTAAIVIGCAMWCAVLMYETVTTGLRQIFWLSDAHYTILKNKLEEYDAYRSAYERDHWHVPERPLNI